MNSMLKQISDANFKNQLTHCVYIKQLVNCIVCSDHRTTMRAIYICIDIQFVYILYSYIYTIVAKVCCLAIIILILSHPIIFTFTTPLKYNYIYLIYLNLNKLCNTQQLMVKRNLIDYLRVSAQFVRVLITSNHITHTIQTIIYITTIYNVVVVIQYIDRNSFSCTYIELWYMFVIYIVACILI